MDVVYTIEDIQNQVMTWKKEGLTVGFVPTMGYLHAGHGSLIKKAKAENDKVVVSIFVNPTQFGVTEDLDSYPRDLEKDSCLIAELGGHLIFHPQVTELYPSYPHTGVTSVRVTSLGDHLCGASRPGHFDGVCLVVSKLFNIVQPDCAYFGEKDYQQLAIIRAMVNDLNLSVHIKGCPIVRETNGLAMSSRNSYLTPEEKQQATVLYQSLLWGKAMIEQGETDPNQIITVLQNKIKQTLNINIDYIQVVCPTTLTPLETVTGQAVIALAVFVGKTRLIDNIVI